jgi:hypothetical protein
VGTSTLLATRPPSLPAGAQAATLTAPPGGTVLADWRWAEVLRRQLGPTRTVIPSDADGFAAEPSQFWVDYLRVAQGHESWADALQRMGVDLVVVDSAGQARAAASLLRQSADWRVLYDADGALVAERARP